MNSKFQPPRLAGWLLTLFTPADQADSIQGDLLEEFSSVATKSNPFAARTWYWRQVLRTIPHNIAASFRPVPMLLPLAVIAGFWLTGLATRCSSHAMRIFLDAHRVYELHPAAYLFWSKFPLEIGRVLICFIIGALVALLAKRIEMVAVLTLVLLQLALFLFGAVALIASGRPWLDWFLFMALWNTLGFIATITGGVIVRTLRSPESPKSCDPQEHSPSPEIF